MDKLARHEWQSMLRWFRILLVPVAALAAVALMSPAMAADGEQVYLVMQIKFKPGKAPEALSIIRDHFQRVDKRIGRKVLPFDFVTGEWDHIVFFPYDLARGDTVPSGEEWMKALAAQEGGMEQAQALWQKVWDLMAYSKTEIARLPRPFAP